MPITINNSKTSISRSVNLNVGPAAAPTSVIIGYVQPTPVPSFIDDCSSTFTNVLCTVPLYMSTSGTILGVNAVYSLGQLPYWLLFDPGVPFFTDSALTTPLTPQGGKVYGFSTAQNGVPNRQIRIASGTPDDYNGWSFCTRADYGYYVVSSTKVNVGNSTRASVPTDDSTTPYIGQRIFQTSGAGIGTNTTIAWALNPNVTATHLITFGASSSSTVISVS